jgi:hypothetical protein
MFGVSITKHCNIGVHQMSEQQAKPDPLQKQKMWYVKSLALELTSDTKT